MKVKALLLAAGLGTRLMPITENIPKCLVSIDNAALLGYWFRMLIQGGIVDLLVNLHHHSGAVEKYISDFFAERLPEREYLNFKSRCLISAANCKTVFEPELPGTGGTLLQNRWFYGNSPVMLVHADNLSLFSVRDFVTAHINRPKGASITMMTFITDSPQTCGIVDPGIDGIVHEMFEKVATPPGNLANAAVYILEPEVVEHCAALGKEFIDFSTDVVPFFFGRIHTFFNKVYHRDIGNLASLERARREFPPIFKKYGFPD